MLSNFYGRILQKSFGSPVLSFASATRTSFGKCRFSSQLSSNVSSGEKNASNPKTADKNVYITLIGTDGIPKTSTLAAAQKLSKRRNLKLIKVSDLDVKRQNPVYKILTGTQVLGEDIVHKKEHKGKSGYKGEKIVSFSYNISEHDLQSKLEHVFKWLEKRHEVRATISGSSSDNRLTEVIYQKIEALLKNHGRILQKRNSGADIKFQVIPLKEKKSVIEENEKNTP